MLTIKGKDYGIKPGIDNYPPIQKAFDYLKTQGGGQLLLPKGTFGVKQAPRLWNNIILTGQGDDTVISNIQTKAGPAQFCIYIGDFQPSTYEEALHFNLHDIHAGDSIITTTNVADARNFVIGELILVDSLEGFRSDDGHWKPYAAFIHKITNIDYTHGIITIQRPISIDIMGAQIGSSKKFKSGTSNNKSYLVDSPIIENLRFESLGDWAMRFGCYNGLFQGLSMKTTDVIPGNGFAFCIWNAIVADFSQKVIETAMYSHDTIIDGLVANWYNGAIDTAMKPIIKMGENVRKCWYRNLQINAGQGQYFGMVIRIDHGYDNKVTDSSFHCEIVKQNGVELTSSDPNTRIIGNEISNNFFYLGNTDSCILVDNSGTTGIISGNKVIKNEFYGPTRKDKVINKVLTQSNDLSGNIFK